MSRLLTLLPLLLLYICGLARDNVPNNPRSKLCNSRVFVGATVIQVRLKVTEEMLGHILLLLMIVLEFLNRQVNPWKPRVAGLYLRRENRMSTLDISKST